MESILFGDNNKGFQLGVNHERPETPPSPISTVPFTRDPDFVNRDIVLDRVREKGLVPGSRIALVGLGGVGKSQLAIEYSYQVRTQSPATWVFWVHASNVARFEQSFRDIADQVEIPGRQDPQANIFKLVKNWIQDEKRGRWVLILDNVDDHEFLRKSPGTGTGDPKNSLMNAPTKPLLEYLPRSLNGSVIITSRTKEVALKIVDHNDLIEVKPMEKSEALKLLERKLGQLGESQESRQLVNALEFMPLAIVQAASYIRNRAPRYSVSQYLRDFEGSDNEATKLLKREAGHLYRDWEAKNSILVTWQISFDHIRRTKPSAADLLSLMSFFDRQAIPEKLLRVQPENNHISSSELVNNPSDDGEVSESDTVDDFEDDITTLRDFSFISVSKNSVFFTMHRLVQLTTRLWLKTHGQTEQWKERFIGSLYYEFPPGKYENWEICRPLFPHVKAAMSQRPKPQESLRNWATLLYNGAWYASQIGNIADARDMASKSTKEMMKLVGAEGEEALDSTTMLARVCLLGGYSEEAERLQVQVMETRKTKLGEAHPSTLTSMNNLAMTYGEQGRWDEAEKLQIEVMETSKMKHSEGHLTTLAGMANLALTYGKQGRWEEAEKLQLEVVEKSKMKLGEDHPTTLSSINNLAMMFLNQGRWDEAEKLQLEVMETRKMKLGEDHPDTLMSMNNLALTYSDQGRWDEAEKLQLEVMEMSKMKLGEDHPATLSSMNNLAMTYGEQGRWEEAKKLQLEEMEMSKMKIGEDHPDTLISMNNLALTYSKQGQWDEAEKLQLEVMEISKMKLGEDHPTTLSSINNLAMMFLNQGRWEEAGKLSMHVMETRKTKLGEDHPDTLMSMNNLALTYSEQGRWEEAKQLFSEVKETSKMKLGEDHPTTLLSMANLATMFSNQGRWGEAEQLEVQVMETRRTKLGEDHPDTMTIMNNLAMTYSKQGRWDEAEQLEVQVMETRRTKLGEDHPDTMTIMNNLAMTYSKQGRWDEAEMLQLEVMEISKMKLGEDHLNTLTSMANLAFTWKSSAQNAEAINLLRDCLIKQKQKLGPNHQTTLSNSATLLAWETENLDMNA